MSVGDLHINVIDTRAPSKEGPTSTQVSLDVANASPEFRKRYKTVEEQKAFHAIGEAQEHEALIASLAKLPWTERLEVNLSELGVGARAVNPLDEAGRNTIREFLRMTPKEVLQVRNFGGKTYEELASVLRRIGFNVLSYSKVEVRGKVGS